MVKHPIILGFTENTDGVTVPLRIMFVMKILIRVWRMDGQGQYVGDEAAQWFSSYLNKPGCKMYQLSQPRVICEDEKWGDVGRPDDKVQLDINSFLRAVYSF